MGTFNSSKTISTTITQLDTVEMAFKQHFENAGYTVSLTKNADGFFASITKTNIFKAVLGMKTSLNVEVKRIYNGVLVEAKVGVFGQQLLPSVITMFVFWPVLLTQVGGLVAQAKLDNEAIQVVEEAVHSAEIQSGFNAMPSQPQAAALPLPPPPPAANKFCANCGNPLNGNAKFCANCGAAL